MSKYGEWNARPRMTPEEFAEWQRAWHEREQAELKRFQLVSRKVIGQIHDEMVEEKSEMRLGTPFDVWFLGQLHISAEGL